MKKQLFVVKDSATAFFDIEVPLLSNSHMFRTTVEDVNSLYNYKDYEEGRFSAICIRLSIGEKEEFNLATLGLQFSSLKVKKCNNEEFKNISCADYIKTINDTTIIRGTVALIKMNRIIYQYITQYAELDQRSADSLSNYLINKIKTLKSLPTHLE